MIDKLKVIQYTLRDTEKYLFGIIKNEWMKEYTYLGICRFLVCFIDHQLFDHLDRSILEEISIDQLDVAVSALEDDHANNAAVLLMSD